MQSRRDVLTLMFGGAVSLALPSIGLAAGNHPVQQWAQKFAPELVQEAKDYDPDRLTMVYFGTAQKLGKVDCLSDLTALHSMKSFLSTNVNLVFVYPHDEIPSGDAQINLAKAKGFDFTVYKAGLENLNSYLKLENFPKYKFNKEGEINYHSPYGLLLSPTGELVYSRVALDIDTYLGEIKDNIQEQCAKNPSLDYCR